MLGALDLHNNINNNCCFAIIPLYVMIITLILMIIINSIHNKEKEKR